MALLLKVMRGNNGTRPQQPRVLTPCKSLMNLKSMSGRFDSASYTNECQEYFLVVKAACA